VVVNVFLTSATVVLNQFAEGPNPNLRIFRELHKNIFPQDKLYVLFYCINEVCCTNF